MIYEKRLIFLIKYKKGVHNRTAYHPMADYFYPLKTNWEFPNAGSGPENGVWNF